MLRRTLITIASFSVIAPALAAAPPAPMQHIDGKRFDQKPHPPAPMVDMNKGEQPRFQRPANVPDFDRVQFADKLDRPGIEDPFDPDFGFEPRDTMALNYVCSIGVDTFHWYRNDSIGGDTFDIDSMATNVSAPFQLAFEVTGSWDFTVHSATSIYVYTAGSGTTAVQNKR